MKKRLVLFTLVFLALGACLIAPCVARLGSYHCCLPVMFNKSCSPLVPLEIDGAQYLFTLDLASKLSISIEKNISERMHKELCAPLQRRDIFG
jgi:hypothetical protein